MFKEIIKYVIATIIALAVLALILINVFSSSILNKEYIFSKLREQNYYEKIYNDVESNFENYIYQSGLDEDVLTEIVTKAKIEQDTKLIINNIYDGMNEKVSTEEIRTKLNENIQKSLNGKISNAEQNSINTFIDTICKEYETTISHTNYENKINSVIKKTNQYVNVAKKALMVVIGVLAIILILLSMKRIYRIIAKIGTIFTIDGSILVIVEKYINSKIKIDTITILNSATSDVLRSILNEILNNILKYGSVLLALGIVLIIIYGFIKSARKLNREKEQYTPEN